MRSTLIALTMVLAAVFRPGAVDAAETRVALVIGNSAYTTVPVLPNPARDSEAVAGTLRSLGFETVRVASDLTYDALRRALRDFATIAEKADWALIYYAGHGMEVGGVNFLIPVDARLKTDRDATFEAIPLDLVLSSTEGARKLRLVILDACRDNPFMRQMTRTIATRSIGRGLTGVEPEGGTLVVYAAKAGQVAFDGQGETSPFVTSLIRRMAEPGVEINKLFRLVRDDVLTATNRLQEPFVYGSLPGEDFFFVPREVEPLKANPNSQPPVVPPLPAPASPPPTVRPSSPQRPASAHRTSPSRPAAAKKIAERPPALRRPAPTSRTSSRPAPAASRGCFRFGGRSYCE
jgi:hypothetical protein